MLKYLVLGFNVSLAVQVVLAFDGLTGDYGDLAIMYLRLIAAFVFVNVGVLLAKIINGNLYMFEVMAIINNIAFLVVDIGAFFYGINDYVSSLDGIITALPSLYFFWKERQAQSG
jgi:hypothetical protein